MNYNLLYKHSKKTTYSDDVIQNAMIVMFNKYSHINNDDESIKIFKTCLYNQYRSEQLYIKNDRLKLSKLKYYNKQINSNIEQDIEEIIKKDKLIDIKLQQIHDFILNELSVLHKSIFFLYYYNKNTQIKIAKTLNLTRQTVSKYLKETTSLISLHFSSDFLLSLKNISKKWKQL